MTYKKNIKIPVSAKGLTMAELEKRLFSKPEFAEGFEELRPEFEVIDKFIRARKKARISQEELADRLKAQQPSIARLEKGGYANTSITHLGKVAHAMGYNLHISLRAKKAIKQSKSVPGKTKKTKV
jgi:DNA-binding XRE family transcriptional regulator